MKITVVYNQVESLDVGEPEDILADQDTVKTAREIAATLATLGHSVNLFEINEKNAREMKGLDTDFFFNTAFGIGSAPKSEAEVAGLLEKTGKPFSGSDRKAIILTTDKIATKDILLATDLPTPKFQVFSNGEKLDPSLKFPLFVKPNGEDCSLGVSQLSVVNNPKSLSRQIKQLRKAYGESVLVEEYIDGRELNTTVLGNGDKAKVLPISEITFGPSFRGKNKIVDFAAKWEEDSDSFKETVGVCPAKLEESLKKRIEEISLKAYEATGCRDYARVDLRLSKNNMPYILEVNANPAVGSGDGATRSAKAAGYSYAQFLQKIIDVALARY